MNDPNRDRDHAQVLIDPPDDGVSFGGTRLLYRRAARGLGVELSEQEDYDWLVELSAGMLVDHLVDTERVNVETSFRDITEGQIRNDLNKGLQIRVINYLRRQSPEKQAEIFRKVQQVNELVIAQRQATKADEVIDIRISEAEIFASILALETESLPDEEARQKFNSWVRGFSRTGYLVDTLVDIRDDFENGETAVRPTVGAGLRYAMAISKESLDAMKKTPPSLLGSCALVAANYVVRQSKVDMQKK